MLASFPVDANLTISKHQWYQFDSNYYNYITLVYLLWCRWIGEKYDGVRICWHPVHKKGYPHS